MSLHLSSRNELLVNETLKMPRSMLAATVVTAFLKATQLYRHPVLQMPI